MEAFDSPESPCTRLCVGVEWLPFKVMALPDIDFRTCETEGKVESGASSLSSARIIDSKILQKEKLPKV